VHHGDAQLRVNLITPSHCLVLEAEEIDTQQGRDVRSRWENA